ncbi:MAG: aldo/keto reductase [Erysipelotrichaceae bacterium]
MQYRVMKDGTQVSLLGFGLMRLPMKQGEIDQEQVNQMVKLAVDAGVNYFDTAYVYHNQKSEGAFAKAIKELGRERVMIADKLPVWMLEAEGDCDRLFATMLERLETDYLDFLLLHAMDFKKLEKVKQFEVIAWGNRMKAEGKIRYFGFSMHERFALIPEMLRLNAWDFVQIQFNYMDIVHEPGLEGYLELERQKIPVIIMEPLKGGTLANIPDHLAQAFTAYDPSRSQASFALRWLMQHQGILCILSGMSNMEHMQDNIATLASSQPLQPEERSAIHTVRAKLEACIKVPCTGCNYCMPCPFGVEIPKTFKVYNERAKYEGSNQWRSGMDYDMQGFADRCVGCNACVSHCPQHINIPKELEIIKQSI